MRVSISELGSLGEFVSSIAVLITLVYVALQIRQNTNATRAVSHHATTDALNQLNLTIATNDQAAQVWGAGLTNRSALDEIQLQKFDALMRAYFHACDTMYYQAQVGAGDHGLWQAEERYLGVILSSPGGAEWFQENAASLSRGFRQAIEEIAQRFRRSQEAAADPMAKRYGSTQDGG